MYCCIPLYLQLLNICCTGVYWKQISCLILPEKKRKTIQGLSLIHIFTFNKNDILHNLTLFLYPDDSDEAGRKLRVYQQYFMVSNAAQLILDEAVSKGCNLHDLADYAVVQINDTHPSTVSYTHL